MSNITLFKGFRNNVGWVEELEVGLRKAAIENRDLCDSLKIKLYKSIEGAELSNKLLAQIEGAEGEQKAKLMEQADEYFRCSQEHLIAYNEEKSNLVCFTPAIFKPDSEGKIVRRQDNVIGFSCVALDYDINPRTREQFMCLNKLYHEIDDALRSKKVANIVTMLATGKGLRVVFKVESVEANNLGELLKLYRGAYAFFHELTMESVTSNAKDFLREALDTSCATPDKLAAVWNRIDLPCFIRPKFDSFDLATIDVVKWDKQLSRIKESVAKIEKALSSAKPKIANTRLVTSGGKVKGGRKERTEIKPLCKGFQALLSSYEEEFEGIKNPSQLAIHLFSELSRVYKEGGPLVKIRYAEWRAATHFIGLACRDREERVVLSKMLATMPFGQWFDDFYDERLLQKAHAQAEGYVDWMEKKNIEIRTEISKVQHDDIISLGDKLGIKWLPDRKALPQHIAKMFNKRGDVIRVKKYLEERKDDIYKLIETNSVLVLNAPTGAGKTTLIGQWMVAQHSKLKHNEVMVVVQPRKYLVKELSGRFDYEHYNLSKVYSFALSGDSKMQNLQDFIKSGQNIIFSTADSLSKLIESGLKIKHLIIDESHDIIHAQAYRRRAMNVLFDAMQHAINNQGKVILITGTAAPELSYALQGYLNRDIRLAFCARENDPQLKFKTCFESGEDFTSRICAGLANGRSAIYYQELKGKNGAGVMVDFYKIKNYISENKIDAHVFFATSQNPGGIDEFKRNIKAGKTCVLIGTSVITMGYDVVANGQPIDVYYMVRQGRLESDLVVQVAGRIRDVEEIKVFVNLGPKGREGIAIPSTYRQLPTNIKEFFNLAQDVGLLVGLRRREIDLIEDLIILKPLPFLQEKADSRGRYKRNNQIFVDSLEAARHQVKENQRKGGLEYMEALLTFWQRKFSFNEPHKDKEIALMRDQNLKLLDYLFNLGNRRNIALEQGLEDVVAFRNDLRRQLFRLAVSCVLQDMKEQREVSGGGRRRRKESGLIGDGKWRYFEPCTPDQVLKDIAALLKAFVATEGFRKVLTLSRDSKTIMRVVEMLEDPELSTLALKLLRDLRSNFLTAAYRTLYTAPADWSIEKFIELMHPGSELKMNVESMNQLRAELEYMRSEDALKRKGAQVKEAWGNQSSALRMSLTEKIVLPNLEAIKDELIKRQKIKEQLFWRYNFANYSKNVDDLTKLKYYNGTLVVDDIIEVLAAYNLPSNVKFGRSFRALVFDIIASHIRVTKVSRRMFCDDYVSYKDLINGRNLPRLTENLKNFLYIKVIEDATINHRREPNGCDGDSEITFDENPF